MSHVVSIAVEFKDLDAIKAACQRLGFTFREGQRTYKWYGHWVDDSPVPRHLFSEAEYERITRMDKTHRQAFMNDVLGKCQHAIRVPGCEYEIGLIQIGEKWVPVWDWYCSDNLGEVLGQDGGPLAQAYAVEKAKIEATQRGYPVVEEQLSDGSIRLQIMENF